MVSITRDGKRVIASIPVESVDEAIAESLDALRSGADLVELRLDYLPEIRKTDVDLILGQVPGERCIITIRSPAEGGVRHHENWIEILRYAMNKGAKIDVEAERGSALTDIKRSSVISRHGDITHLCMMERDIESYPGMEYKGVFEVRSLKDVSDLVAYARCLNARGKRFFLMGSGPLGNFTRYLLPLFGSGGAYVHTGRATAGCQPLLTEYKRVMDSIHLSEPEGIVCLLGKNIGYTLSPVMHNSALERYNIPWVYLPLDLDEDFIPLVRDCSSLPIKGFNVTTPYKEKVIMFLDSVSKECEEIRAVNTITIHNGKLCGYNTDAPAFRDVLMQRVHARGIENLSGLKALVIGAGGVARSAVYTLKKEGAEIYLINRSESRAERLAGEFGCKMWGGLSSGKKFIPEVDLIVNCTPVSSSDELPIPRGSITPHHIVMDMVYQPFRTVLLERAAEQGATVIEGIHTLAHQAALSFKLWTDRDITPDFMLDSAMKYIMHNNSRQ